MPRAEETLQAYGYALISIITRRRLTKDGGAGTERSR